MPDKKPAPKPTPQPSRPQNPPSPAKREELTRSLPSQPKPKDPTPKK